MGGDVITKVLVLMAGLIAMGASAGPLLYDPAVEEAEQERVLEADPLVGSATVDGDDLDDAPLEDLDRDLDARAAVDPVTVDPETADPIVEETADGEAVVVDTLPDSAVIGEPIPEAGDGEVVGEPVVGEPVVGEPGAAGAEPALVAPDLAGDPERTVIPFFVTLPVLLIALALTVWAMITPAAELGRPALIAGALVLIGTLLAWGLYELGLSDFEMNGTALAAWLCVGFTLLAAWLVVDVLSTPSEDEAVPG